MTAAVLAVVVVVLVVVVVVRFGTAVLAVGVDTAVSAVGAVCPLGVLALRSGKNTFLFYHLLPRH